MTLPLVRRSSVVASLLALVLLTGATACIPGARVGARCRTTDWGDGGANVLRCVNGRWRVAMSRQQAINALVALANAARRPEPVDPVSPATLGTPHLPNTADPSVFVENGLTYVYATSTYQKVPVAVLSNPDATIGAFQTTDAMPTKPPWAVSPEIWAPTVNKVGGRYVMFFAAHRSGAPNANSDQCVGKAVATSPTGPFIPADNPTTCGHDGVSGALDPSLFLGPDGNATLLVAMGGSNVNIWSIPLNGNADPSGPDVALLKREQPWQDWFLENPAMLYNGPGNYLLAYSSGHWDSPEYMTGVARCASPAGPCTDRAAGPWLASVGDRVGPGGLEFFRGPDGQDRVAFHTYPAGDVGPIGKRSTHIRPMYTDPRLRLD